MQDDGLLWLCTYPIWLSGNFRDCLIQNGAERRPPNKSPSYTNSWLLATTCISTSYWTFHNTWYGTGNVVYIFISLTVEEGLFSQSYSLVHASKGMLEHALDPSFHRTHKLSNYSYLRGKIVANPSKVSPLHRAANHGTDLGHCPAWTYALKPLSSVLPVVPSPHTAIEFGLALWSHKCTLRMLIDTELQT